MKALSLTLFFSFIMTQSSFALDQRIACSVISGEDSESTCVLGTFPLIQEARVTSQTIVTNCTVSTPHLAPVQIVLGKNQSRIIVRTESQAEVILPRRHPVAGETFSGSREVTLADGRIIDCGAIHHHGLKLVREGL